MGSPEIRKAERNAFCRACDKTITKSDDMVSWYSHRNQGMHIHLCLSCAKDIGAMVTEHKNILAGAEIHADKGYRESTLEEAEAFAAKRNYKYE
jgi:uncharacterized protein YlaI